jgi:hypothetical protein
MTPANGFVCSCGSLAQLLGKFLTIFLRKADLAWIGMAMMAFEICGIGITCNLTLRISNFSRQQGMLLLGLPP